MTTQPIKGTAGDDDRRHQRRKKFNGSIEIDWGSAILSGTVRDIGPRGLFVEMALPLWIGATFRARLNLNPALALDCRVARVEPQTGIGVEFDVVEESGRSQLEALLTSLSQA
jgi:hypothetical protein